jgi:ubiquinone/menaquinone biosynthesis C-methylase UbiE
VALRQVIEKIRLIGRISLNILPRWFIKLGFHLLYYQMAWTYDLVAWSVSFGQWAAWRRLVLQFIQPGPILELAYGTGGLLVDMLEAGYRPVGIDLSPYMARLASRQLCRQNMALRLSQAKAQALPFPANHFSNVVATFPTNYIFDDETLAEVHRVLKAPLAGNGHPTGRLIIVVEGQLRGPWLIRPFINWLYKITDQHNFPAIKPLPLFDKHNFTARWEIVEHEKAQARLLVADVRFD